MKDLISSRKIAFRTVVVLLMAGGLLLGSAGSGAGAQGDPSAPVQIIAVQGTNWWIAPRGAADWVLASTRVPQTVQAGDRVRTGRDTRLFLQTPHLGVIQLPPLSTIEISAPPGAERSLRLRILNGMLYFFHRGSPTDVEVHSRTASAAVRGTEFVAEALEDGGLAIRVVEGAVDLRNDQGDLHLRKGEQGAASSGRQPLRTPVLYALKAIQWCLYYPAILDVSELPWSAAAEERLRSSLQAYREGDVVAALAAYPMGEEPGSPEERVYLAALWLAVGQVRDSERLLEAAIGTSAPGSSPTERLASAIRLMVAATQLQEIPAGNASPPVLASEWLAESYARQSQGQLGAAREAARQATLRSPGCGFAWVRLAELEFGFGRTHEAGEALLKGRQHAPRHAAARVLQGFQLSARNRIAEARDAFDSALALDPGLGNAWLGRGLCLIRQGQVEAGLADLEVAAAVEPQRALLRSYLGKAFVEAGDLKRAIQELGLAQTMDPRDPTAWLYLALVDQQEGRINQGIRNLERSKQLNDQRRLDRSRHLLDQDQAVRGANLSALYRDASFLDLSRREAVDAVNTDYANFSSHLFLANSYNDLRDPGQVDLRYETPWLNEYLLANLLAPVGAGTLSQTVSAQEFSRFFERDGLGLVSLTEYASRGDWRESAAQYGLLGNLAFTLEADYRSLNGERPNADLEERTLSLKLKQQIGPSDSLYLQVVDSQAKGGDLARVYDPNDLVLSRSRYRFREDQEPLFLAGYHHEWSPGQHTLVLAGRLQDQLEAADPAQPVLLVARDLNHAVTGTVLTSVEQHYRSQLEIYSLELQHIAQFDRWTFIGGGRGQFGDFDTLSRLEHLADQAPALPSPLEQRIDPNFHRWAAYGYAQWRALDPLTLFTGLAYDHLQSPANHRFAPLQEQEETRDQWSPKAGAVWKMAPHSTLSGAYTRSLGGVSLDQSYRIEPSQVAGFNQSWRGLIPESVAGAQSAARLEMVSLEWDHRFPTESYLSLRGDIGQSKVQRQVGIFDLPFLAEPSSTLERLRFKEQTFTCNLSQLLGRSGTVGVQYRLTRAQLDDDFPGIPGSVPHFFPPYELRPHQALESLLHQLQLFAGVNLESGFFARIESLWSRQSNQGNQPDRPGDDFWQLNVFGGYRFPHRQAELRLGVLNLTDQDYRLHPLNLTPDLPRHRTFVTSLRFGF